MNSNCHLHSPNLQPTTDHQDDQGWQNVVETDEKCVGAKGQTFTAANEINSHLKEMVSDHTEKVCWTMEANVEAKATVIMEEMMKKQEEELYKLVDEIPSPMDMMLKRVAMMSTNKEQERASGMVAGGQTKKLEQTVKDSSKGEVYSDAIERMLKVDQRVQALEKSVRKAVYHLLPKVDALFESLDFSSTAITNERMKLSLLSAAGFRIPHSKPHSLSSYSISRLDKDLLIASNCGIQGIVNELLLVGADKNVKCALGYTPLQLAAKNSHVNVLNILLENGADVNGDQRKGMTPLHWAAFESSPPCVAALIAAGADVNRKTENDWTPLHFACIVDCKCVVELLLRAGADRSIKTVCGKMPYDLVISEGVKKLFKDTDRGLSLYYHLLKVFQDL